MFAGLQALLVNYLTCIYGQEKLRGGVFQSAGVSGRSELRVRDIGYTMKDIY